MTAPAFRAAGVGGTSSTTSTAVAKPVGLVAGDVMFATIAHGGLASPPTAPPTGWDLVASDMIGSFWAGVYMRRATASEPSSYTWSGFSVSCAGSMIAVSGADEANPIHAFRVQVNDDSGVACESITTTVPECFIIGAVGVSDNQGATAWTATDPATLTSRTNLLSSGGDDTASAIATGEQISPGPTGALRATLAGSRDNVSFLLAIQPPQVSTGITGALNATLPALVVESAGTVETPETVTASLNVTLPALMAASSGTARATGSLNVTLPGLTVEAAGSSTTGALATQLPAFVVTGGATVSVPARLDVSLPPLSMSTSGAATVPAGMSATLPMLSAVADALVAVEGEAVAVLPALVAVLTAASETSGSALDATLPALQAGMHGVVLSVAGFSSTLPELRVSASASAAVEGQADTVLPKLAVQTVATVQTPVGSLDTTLPMLAATAAGTVSSLAQTHTVLPMPTAAMAGRVDTSGVRADFASEVGPSTVRQRVGVSTSLVGRLTVGVSNRSAEVTASTTGHAVGASRTDRGQGG